MRRVPPVGFPETPGVLLTAARRSRERSRRDLAHAAVAALTEATGRSVLALVDSGTSALRVALDLLAPPLEERAPRPLVAIPAYGCIDVPTAVLGAGWQAVAYDLDPHTLAPDTSSLDRAVDAGARVVIVAHWFCHPVDVAALRARYASRHVHVFEDCAQATGATMCGVSLGRAGDLAVLSLGRGKGLVGTGGGVLLGGEALGLTPLPLPDVTAVPSTGVVGALVRGLAAAGLSRPSVYFWPAALPWLHLGEMRFHPPHPVQGMPTITMALLPEALRRAESHRSDRARLAVRLQAVAEVSGFGIPRPPAGAQPGWLRLPLLLPDRRASEVLPVDLGVVRPYQRPLGEQHEVASVVQNARAAMPGAGVLAARLVTIPVHRFVDATDEARLQRWLQRGA